MIKNKIIFSIFSAIFFANFSFGTDINDDLMDFPIPNQEVLLVLNEKDEEEALAYELGKIEVGKKRKKLEKKDHEKNDGSIEIPRIINSRVKKKLTYPDYSSTGNNKRRKLY